MKLEVIKANDNHFTVQYELDNGYTSTVGVTSNEVSARAMAIGFEAGMCAVKNMIGLGARFDGNIKSL